MLPSNLKALKTNSVLAGGLDAGAAAVAGAGAGAGVTVWSGGVVACTGASSSVLAALVGLGDGKGGNLIHPSSVEDETGGVLRAALGLSF